VKIRALDLRPFRNFDHAHFAFDTDRTLLSGPNGRGKTNILEAISYLSIGKSVRGARDQQAIPHAGEFFDIRGTCLCGERHHELRLFFGRTEGKRAFSEEEPIQRVSELLGLFRTVHFAPEDVALVLRFPAQRRRLLDILNAQSSSGYLRSLQRYHRVLSQRNAILRSPGGTSDDALRPWTEQLASTGGAIRQQRLETLEQMRERFAYCSQRLGHKNEHVSVAYRGASTDDASQVDALQQQLTDKAPQERALGYTLAGPHRDDLVFKLNDRPADTYASEGQLKSVLIAWKIAEVSFLERTYAGQPVLLLDDVLSELDERRADALMEIVDDFEQVIITTPRPLPGKHTAGFQEIALWD
jgi:DNA replication and repair protein RecF